MLVFCYSHNRHSVAVRTERSVLKFRLVRGTGHFPDDRIVFRFSDQITSRHRAHVGVRLHFLQFAAGQVAVRCCGRHHVHVVAVNIDSDHGKRTIKTGDFIVLYGYSIILFFLITTL